MVKENTLPIDYFEKSCTEKIPNKQKSIRRQKEQKMSK